MNAPDKIYLTPLLVEGCGKNLSKRVTENDAVYIREDLIRAEIEMLHAQHSSKYETDEAGLVLERLEDFISTLESEKPINQSARQRLAEWSKTPEGRESYEKVASEMRMELALDDEVKNYFKEWVDEDTDSVHNGCAINDSNQYVSLCDCARIARHFAQWAAEKFAKIIRANLAQIDKNVQSQFEHLYMEITESKMYGGYND